MKTYLTIFFFLSAFTSNAQRTMFSVQNNYAAPVIPFQAPAVVTSGLVLLLDAANPASYPGTGTTWTDLSSSTNVGTLIGSPSFSSSVGGTMVFNGNNGHNYISVADNASLNLTTAGSLSIWINPNTLSQPNFYTSLISKTIGGGAAEQSYYLYWTGGNIYGIIQNNGEYKIISTPIPTSLGWYNYVFTWGNGYLNLYKNGVSVSTPVASTMSAQSLATPVNIGGFIFLGAGLSSNTFDGEIPIVSIYNRWLTPAEVLTNFDAVKSRFGF